MTAPGSSADVGPPDWDRIEAEAEAREPRGNRRWWVIGVVSVVLMSGLAVIWGLSAVQGRVHWVYTGHQVVSESEVEVRFDLRRDPSREVTCRIEAQAETHVVVGRTEVDIAPTASSPTRQIVGVTTASPAITGYVDQCWYTDEAPRD